MFPPIAPPSYHLPTHLSPTRTRGAPLRHNPHQLIKPHQTKQLDNPLVPIHLLVFGVQSFVTSVACLVEVWSWTDRSTDQKTNITFLYAPYVALGKLTVYPSDPSRAPTPSPKEIPHLEIDMM